MSAVRELNGKLLDLSRRVISMQELTVWDDVAQFLAFWAGVLQVVGLALTNVDDEGDFAWPEMFPPAGKFFLKPPEDENLPVAVLLERKFTLEEEGDLFGHLVASHELVQRLRDHVPDVLGD